MRYLNTFVTFDYWIFHIKADTKEKKKYIFMYLKQLYKQIAEKVMATACYCFSFVFVFYVIWNTHIQEVTFEAHISRLTTGVAIRAFNKLKWTDKERRFSGTKRARMKGKGMQPAERDVRTEKRRWRRADWC